MIGRIAGLLDHRGADHVLIDVNGVGYVVHVSERTLSLMPAPGEPVALYTDLMVREDLLQLFGFPTLAEKEWHRLLTTVQGVGARASLAMLGAVGAQGVGKAIMLGDWHALRAAPGIGPKLAQRVVNELREKAPTLMALDAGAPAAPVLAHKGTPDGGKAMPATPPPAAGSSAMPEAISALVNLGYGQTEAATAVAAAARDTPDSDTAALIRAALRALAPGA